jgi:(5-formylfuran-3-yl)methyl phosphate synthase
MMQLLVSVKNPDEALLALDAGVDMIDLKDPNNGALGALDLQTTELILQALDGGALVSATVGDVHATIAILIRDITARTALGVNIIKIAVNDLFAQADFCASMRPLSANGIKLVAVFNAENEINFAVLPKLQQAGFYGAMLDTQNKQHALLEIQTNALLQRFVIECEKYHLVSGLAGSLKPQHIEELCKINPKFIGFRGGVCESFVRESSLSQNKMALVKNVLLKHNKISTKARKSMNLALHS